MTTTRRGFTRRRFLGVTATSATAVALGHLLRAVAAETKKRKTILSFYCDDTKPSPGGAKGFETFLDYCQKLGIKGESSVILGMGGNGSITRTSSAVDKAYLEQVRRAWQCGIDSQMEFMTHWSLFNFETNSVISPQGSCGEWNPEKCLGMCECLFVRHPDVSVELYERYFGNIIAEGQRADIRFTGITWPGSSCKTCRKREADLRAAGVKTSQFNPSVWQALLNLAKQGKFRGPVVTCFYDYSEKDFGVYCKASDGEYAVFNLMPNAGRDRFGSYTNKAEEAEVDYYITADGKSGLIPRRVLAGEPYCLWYGHWQGMNPINGVGWSVLNTLVERVQRHFKDRVVWMRPSDITANYHKAGGWSFLDTM